MRTEENLTIQPWSTPELRKCQIVAGTTFLVGSGIDAGIFS